MLKSSEIDRIRKLELENENQEMNHELITLKTERGEECRLKEKISNLAEENRYLKSELEEMKTEQLKLERVNQEIRRKMRSLSEMLSKSNSAIEVEEELARLEERLKEVETEKMVIKEKYEAKLSKIKREISTKEESRNKSQVYDKLIDKIKTRNPSIQVVKEHKSITLMDNQRQILHLDLENSFETRKSEVDQNVSLLDSCTLGDILSEEKEEHKFVRLNTFTGNPFIEGRSISPSGNISCFQMETPSKERKLRSKCFTTKARTKHISFSSSFQAERIEELELIFCNSNSKFNQSVRATGRVEYSYCCQNSRTKNISKTSFSYLSHPVRVENQINCCANCVIF